MWLQLAAAFAVNWVIGGVWYHPALFGYTSIGDRKKEDLHMGFTHVIGIFIFAMMEVFGLYYVLVSQNVSSVIEAAKWGYFVWQFFVCPSIGVHYLFDGRPIKELLVKWGHHLVALVLECSIMAYIAKYY